MNLLHANKKKQQRLIQMKRIALIATLLVLLGVSAVYISQAGQRTGKFLWTGKQQATVGIAKVIDSSMSKKKLLQQNALLEEENIVLRTKVLLLEETQRKLATLEEQTKRTKPEELVVVGWVLSRPPQTLYDTVIIDKGLRDGIQKFDQATIANSVFLGTVFDLSPATSKVQLVSSGGNETKGRLVKDGVTTSVTLQGKGGGTIEIHISREIDIVQGDRILDETGRYLVAIVENIVFDPRDPFQTIYARIPVNMHEIEWINILSS